MKDRRITIVGGAGFVGHHLAEAFMKRGAGVQVIDCLLVNNLYALQAPSEVHERQYQRMLKQRAEILDGAEFRVLDARDYDLLSRAVGHFKPDTLVHLAAVAHIDRSRKDPYSTFDHSLRTLENALDVSVQTGVGRLVYFSSSTVYGDFKRETITEAEPSDPVGTYGSLKMAGELLVRAYTKDTGLRHTIIRPQALYGPRCISRRVTQVFIEAALTGEPLKVHGDGSARHDFTYIDDLVDGVVLAAGSHRAINETFNMTGQSCMSVLQLAKLVCDELGGEITHVAADPEKPSRGIMSCRKATHLLGYQSRFGIIEGMTRYMEWYKSFWDASRPARTEPGRAEGARGDRPPLTLKKALH